MAKNLTKGLSLLESKNKKKFYKILIIQFLKSLFDIFGVASIIPLIYLLVESDKFIVFYNNKISSYNLNFLYFDNFQSLLIFIILFLFIFFFIKFLFSVFAFNYEIKWQQKLITKLCTKLFSSYLKLDIEKFVSKKNSDLIRNINSEVNQYVKFYIQPLYLLFAETFKIVGISFILIIFKPKFFLIIVSISLIFVFIFNFFLKKKILKLGADKLIFSGLILKYIEEGIGSLKEIKLTKNKDYFVKLYNKIAKKNEKLFVKYNFLSFFPRYVIELISITFILALILFSYFSYNSDFSSILIVLAVYSAAFFRLLPSISLAYQHYSAITFSEKTVLNLQTEFTNNFIDESLSSKKISITNKQEFEKINSISLINLNYQYPNSKKQIFENINLEFKKGFIYGIKGDSGSGKTTLINLIIGFLKANSGKILINNKFNIINNLRNWQDKISYMPQKSFLINETIRNNIALGEYDDEINNEKIEIALKKANLSNVIESKKLGLNEMVGQSGVFLSEGQKQRIGIARLLYFDKEIIFLDEFTSALDKINEELIIERITKLKSDRIIFLISHSSKLLNHSDYILEINEGRINMSKKV
tara:strand:- start:3308 stop:5074 length:1767 start_codon:yes stop_codon:yes gene_type:complete